MQAVQALLDRHVPNDTARKWVWFVLLWLFGIAALTVLATILKLPMQLF
ncbi:MAG: DUF2474 family protein [Alphaproteobacteria bacterium]|nr:DUF2474 family protein [Alphaproteobacteria bacterium]